MRVSLQPVPKPAGRRSLAAVRLAAAKAAAKFPARFLVLLALLILVPAGQAGERKPKANASPEDHAARMAEGLRLFKTQVRRMLVSRCVRCHGGQETESDLDLTTRAGLLRGGAEGPVVEPGNGAASRLYKLVAHVEEPYMPEEGAPLDERSVALLRRWIDLGAPYDKPLIESEEDPLAWTRRTIDPGARQFWSFQPLHRVEPPRMEDDRWSRTPIDRFVLAKLRGQRLQPNAVASRRTLVRRAYFDLVGLPPPAAEVERFVRDPDPMAYERLIDRLLASPHYGERWGRHWLDVARFGESFGFEQDYDRPYAYHYRDFVIRALNEDMPFDQFVRWQLAGDEIAPDNPLALAATGFLGAGVFPTQLTEKEFERARYDELDDMLSTAGNAMLGLTIGCARCHDHKYDPIPAADYYRLLSAFTQTIRSVVDVQVGADGRVVQLKPAPRDEKKKTNSTDKQQPAAPPIRPTLAAARGGWVRLMISTEGLPPIKHHADGRGYPHFYPQTYFLKRGDPAQKHGPASLGFLQVLTRSPDGNEHWIMPPPAGSRTSGWRRAMADWMTDTRYGAGDLLARVIVNRLWQHHLGRGLVATPNDFGFQGGRPTHPQLLDWLAAELIRNGWHLKPLHKLIMTSGVYMQSSSYREQAARVDPDNRWLWRYQPHRLESETIRDALLAVGGQLDRRMYGPGSLDPSMRRRSIYFMIKRSKLIGMMQLLDAPEPLVSVGRRPSTTIAPQALLFMNSPQVRQCAEGLADRVCRQSPTGGPERMELAWRIALGRPPAGDERQSALKFLREQTARYATDGLDDAGRLAWIDVCQVLLSLNEFVYVQ